MKSFNNWGSLIAAAQKAAASILKDEVSTAAKKIVDKHIQSDIYDAYSPVGSENSGYDRRGALGNSNNTVSRFVDDSMIIVTNEAPPSPPVFPGGVQGQYPDELLYWIENGLVPNYFNDKQYAWQEPRPAIKGAQEEFESGPDIRNAIISGIKKRFGG